MNDQLDDADTGLLKRLRIINYVGAGFAILGLLIVIVTNTLDALEFVQFADVPVGFAIVPVALLCMGVGAAIRVATHYVWRRFQNNRI